MIDALMALIAQLVGWVATVFPASPFLGILEEQPEGIETGLAWLNTFVPVSDIVTLVTAWAVAMGAVLAALVFKKYTFDEIRSTIGI